MRIFKGLFLISMLVTTSVAFGDTESPTTAGGRLAGKIVFGKIQLSGPVVVSLVNAEGPGAISYVLGERTGKEVHFKLDAVPFGKYKVQAVMRMKDPGCLPLAALKSSGKGSAPDSHPIVCNPFEGDVFGAGLTPVQIKKGEPATVQIHCINLVK